MQVCQQRLFTKFEKMSNHSSIDSKRIARNTIFLYLRMIISLVVTLYTSRVIINTLGIEDFGIYNIIGGVIVLFNFVSHSLRIASQRFLSYELGKNDCHVGRVFNTAFQCQILIAFLIVLLAESIGLYFFHNHLNIPDDRLIAAEYVFQFSLITFVISLFHTPYHALIISYEKMSFYAFVSIIDVLMKLLVVYLLLFAQWDKLIVYSILMSIVAVVSLLFSSVYCYKYLNLTRFSIQIDKVLFKEVFGYAGWSMVSGSATLGSQQGGNILLNVYNGVSANAAFGIANQVNNAIYGFVSNFQSAFNPQIVKSYASEQYRDMYTLINRTSLFSYYLLLIIAVPFIVKAEFVLKLWLGVCPEYAAGFCILMLIYFLIDAIQAPLWMLIGATGKVKVYTLWSSSLAILTVPLAWILLKLGYSIYWVFITRVLINFICAVIRPFYLKSLVHDFSVSNYFTKVIIRAFSVTSIIVISYFYASNILDKMNSIVVILISIAYTVILVALIGLDKNDKEAIARVVLAKINKN